jgi:hypothetical protein
VLGVGATDVVVELGLLELVVVGAVVKVVVGALVLVVVGVVLLIVTVTVSVAELITKVGMVELGGPPFTEYVAVHPAGTESSSSPHRAPTLG